MSKWIKCDRIGCTSECAVGSPGWFRIQDDSFRSPNYIGNDLLDLCPGCFYEMFGKRR